MEEEICLVFRKRFSMTPRISPIDSHSVCLRPELTVRLKYGDNSIDTPAIVDSGADYSAFPKDFAISLGVPKDELIPVSGEWDTSKGILASWCGEITIMIVGYWFPCRVVFLDDPDWFPVIGREPIFRKLMFAFRQSMGEFYIA